ncbi:MAG: hypothetical protein U0835_07620 [Isosphaeraceae bacterium]
MSRIIDGPVEELAGVLGHGDALAREPADLLRGGLASFGKFPHLAGDDRELLARAPARAASIAAFRARRFVW